MASLAFLAYTSPDVERLTIGNPQSFIFNSHKESVVNITRKFSCLVAALLTCLLAWGGQANAVWCQSQTTNSAAQSATEVQPLQVGAELPKVTLLDSEGKEVDFTHFSGKGPLIIVFFRGSWCPFCNRHNAELVKAYPELKKLGAELIAISPDSVENSKANLTANKLPFPVLSDAKVEAAKAFGLGFVVDEKTRQQYQGFGIDLAKASGFDHYVLPVPAVYIADTQGKIIFAHTEADYRQRLDVAKIVQAVKKSQ
jgi:peroxiredoxin